METFIWGMIGCRSAGVRWLHKLVSVTVPIRLVGALVCLLASPAAAQKPDLGPLESQLHRITASTRGRVGVAIIHIESGSVIDIRGNEWFPMASVVKLPIAIEVLSQVSERKLQLDRQVAISASDVRPCCTIEQRHPNGGISRSVVELLALAMIESDNTAADALLSLAGGPALVQRRMRALGFSYINVNRSEGQLLLDMAGVTHAPPPREWTVALQRRLVAEVDRVALDKGREQYLLDPRDTATPLDIARLLARLHLYNLLPKTETDLLVGLMTETRTGARRIKGRLPPETQVAHKTGTTAIVINDAGIVTLPADSKIGGHLAIAVFVAGGSSIRAMERAVANLSAAAYEFFTGRKIPPQPVPRRRIQRRAVSAEG